MVVYVVADAPEDYERWAAAQRAPAATPVTSQQKQGQEIFLSRSCVMCHAINGTSAQARRAPDLTHVASRMTLGAGTLENTSSMRAAWILDPQRFKPGVNMPPENLAVDDLAALNAYLASLK
jgi:cytochrome c oxidase subunit 2